MKTPHPGKKYTFFLLFLMLGVTGMAQKFDLKFFPINGIEPRQQSFAGRIDDHFFLVSNPLKPGLELYIYDSTTHEGAKKSYDFPRTLSSIVVKPASILFTALQPGNLTTLHFLELDKTGGILLRKESQVDMGRGPVNMTSSSDKKYILLYQLKKRGADSVLVKGFLFDQAGNSKKSIAYVFKQNSELDAEPELFLDVFGNTHILVYDRFANYRLSTDLTVNTIPVADEQIVSETFTFEKVKLKNMRVFQNTECSCIQAEGMYVDGLGKGNKGIYSIAFPPGRKNEVAPRFIPFNETMIRNLKRGFSATDEMIRNAIQLQEIIYSDSGSFAILKLSAGIPQPLHVTGPEDPATKWANRSVANARAGDVISSINPNAIPTGSNRIAMRMNTIPSGDKPPAGLLGRTELPSDNPPVFSKSSGRNAPKLICVKLEKELGFEWMQSRPLDVFNIDYDMYNQVSLMPGEKREISALLYQGDKLNQPYPVLLTIKEGMQIVHDFPEKKLLFSSFLFLGHHQYGSLYYNQETGVGGLMVISGRE